MRVFEFYALCGEHAVDPDIALENEKVRAAIKADATREQLAKILSEEF